MQSGQVFPSYPNRPPRPSEWTLLCRANCRLGNAAKRTCWSGRRCCQKFLKTWCNAILVVTTSSLPGPEGCGKSSPRTNRLTTSDPTAYGWYLPLDWRCVSLAGNSELRLQEHGKNKAPTGGLFGIPRGYKRLARRTGRRARAIASCRNPLKGNELR